MNKLLLLLFSLPLFGFDDKPWFYQPGEFQFRPSYQWRHYHDVDNGFNPSTYSSTDQWIDVNFGVSPWPNWDVQIGMNFADTKKHDWSYLSTGALVRYLILDDVMGDAVSLAFGGLLRSVNGHFLNDVSIDYHANLNLELRLAIGQEIDRLYNWVFRWWGLFAPGIGNRGAPWIRGDLHLEGNFDDIHTLEVFGETVWGLGGQEGINVERFHSYANIDYSGLDIGARYGVRLGLWGTLSAAYAYRVYAHNFPEHAHTVRVAYRLPFSLF